MRKVTKDAKAEKVKAEIARDRYVCLAVEATDPTLAKGYRLLADQSSSIPDPVLAAEYRSKAADCTDPLLARGYLQLAAETEQGGMR